MPQIAVNRTNDKEGHIVLTISDHVHCESPHEYLLLLQKKINTYLNFLDGGEASLLHHVPTARCLYHDALPVHGNGDREQRALPACGGVVTRARPRSRGAQSAQHQKATNTVQSSHTENAQSSAKG